MPYTPDTWANNDPTKPLNATRLTKLAGQYPQVMADLPAKIADSGDPIGAALSSTIGSVAGVGIQQQSARAVGSGLLVNPEKLSRWTTRRAREFDAPAVITITGHSIVHGVGSNNVNGGTFDAGRYRECAWPAIAAKRFAREHNQPPALGFIGFYPAYTAATGSSIAPVATASVGPFGNYTSNSLTYGGFNLSSAERSFTITPDKAGRFTHLDIFYWGSDSGVSNPVRPKVILDNVVVDAGTSTVVTGNLNVLSLTGLSDQAHRVVIQHPGTSANFCYVFGMVTHRGSGVIVNRIGAPGAKVYDIGSTLTGTGRTRALEAATLASYSDMVTLMIDTNDISAQTPITEFKSQLQEVITHVEAAGACVLLVKSPNLNGGESLTIPESAYRTALIELSDANTHTVFWDGSGVLGERTQAVADGLYPPDAPTTVHPGLKGHDRLGTAYHAALPPADVDYVGGPVPGFSDTFDRADSGTTLGLTANNITWETYGGAWGTSGNAAYATTATGNSWAFAEALAYNGTLTCVLGVASNFCGVIFRWQDPSNHLYVTRSGSNLILGKRVGGIATTIATATGGAPADGDTISVEMSGTSIVVKKNGTTLLTQTVTEFATATKHGMYSPSTSAARFNSISYVAA